MSKLSYGLNITKKGPSLASRPPPAKRKTIFDDDGSGPEDEPNDEENTESIQTVGGLKSSGNESSSKIRSPDTTNSGKPVLKKSLKASLYGDLSTNHSTFKHSKGAQEIDPSIYEYDAVYDSLHVKPISKLSSSSDPAGAEDAKKPKYMAQLLAASEVRKRDQVRAKEKMLAKEREAEGDEFAHKEKFVTAAYKRQQEEMRKAEEEEAEREKQAEARRRREGGGMKSLYKSMLDRDEERHQQTMKQMEELKKTGPMKPSEPEEHGSKQAKSEEALAKEKGALLNEDGEVVDKRQLLNAGLNAASAPKPKSQNPIVANARSSQTSRSSQAGSKSRIGASSRESETRAFEDQLLGKRSAEPDSDDGEAARASKSRKMGDGILAMIGQ